MSEPSTNVMTPKKLSLEHRAKLSEVQRQRWAAGRKVSEETKMKMSESAMGHAVSDETRQKMVRAALRREARRRGEDLPGLEDPRILPAVLHVPGRGDYRATVMIVSGEETEFFVGRDAFTTSEEALRVAEARVRARMEDADGRG